MCNLFILEFNIFVHNVVIRQLGNKTINNMCNLFTMELNILVCNVTIRQVRNNDLDNMCILFTMELHLFSGWTPSPSPWHPKTYQLIQNLSSAREQTAIHLRLVLLPILHHDHHLPYMLPSGPDLPEYGVRFFLPFRPLLFIWQRTAGYPQPPSQTCRAQWIGESRGITQSTGSQLWPCQGASIQTRQGGRTLSFKVRMYPEFGKI